MPLRKIKKEPEDRPARKPQQQQQRRRATNSSSSSRSRSRSPSPPPRLRKIKQEPGTNKPTQPPVVPMGGGGASSPPHAAVKQAVKLTLKASNATKPGNKKVLEKLGLNHDEDGREATAAGTEQLAGKKRKNSDAAAAAAEKKRPSDKASGGKKKEKTADRREELLKQLKAVENAIAKKRTKIDG